MAEDRTGHEELLRLLLEYKQKYGEKDGWLLLALSLVHLGQMVGLIEKRAAVMPAVPAGKEAPAGPAKGLVDLLCALGPLVGSLKSSPPRSAPEQPPPEESRPGEPRPARNEVIKWDPRLVGGARK